MDVIDWTILIVQIVLATSVIYGILFGRILMRGRWLYRGDNGEYWVALVFQCIALLLFLYFFGVVVF